MSIINIKSNTPFGGFYIIFKGSVANETEKNYGISHLMEHLICKNIDDMLSDFARDGIDWNAYTGDNEIVFHFTGLEKYLTPYKKTILDKLLAFKTTKAQLENEVKIVLQEYNNYFTNQPYAHFFNLNRRKFDYFSPIGSAAALKKITLDDCAEYFELQYSKPTTIINISPAGMLFEETVDMQPNYKNLTLKKENPNAEIELLSQFKETSSIINYKLMSNKVKEHKIICAILGEGLESPLYKLIREEKGLTYYVSCYLIDSYKDTPILNITSELSDNNVPAFQAAVKEVLSKDLSEERFEVIRSSRRVKLEEAEILNYRTVQKYIEPDHYIDLDFINSMDYHTINKIYREEYHDLIESVDKKEFPQMNSIQED